MEPLDDGGRTAARRRTPVLAALVAVGAASCAELPELQVGVCGNGVLEAELGEQCDLSEDPTLGAGTRCADPSDTVRACRYVCSRTDANAPKCPLAWGCGEDGVCHHADGSFAETEDSPLELLPYAKLALADMDGDGRKDLVTSANSGVSVHFAKKDGAFSSSFDYDVQNVASAMVLGDIDRDGASDLVLSSLVGPIVLRGQRDHTLAPVIYSRITARTESEVLRVESLGVAAMRVPDCASGGASHGTVAAALVAFRGGLELVVPDLDLHYTVRSPTYDGTAPSRLVVADVDGDPATDELVLAPPGARRAHVISLACRSTGTPKLELLAMVDLPAPAAGLGSNDVTLTRDNVLVGRASSEHEHADLLFAVEAEQPGYPPRVAVARGLGHGSFARAELDQRFCALSGFCMGLGGATSPPIASFGEEWPLAVGDLDGDGVVDYVGTNGIYLTARGTGELVLVASPRRLSHWTRAELGDMNGDGLPDVAAASDDPRVLGIELAASSVIGATIRRAYETQSKLVTTLGRPSALRAGDYDGDGIRDLAFLESGLLREVTLSVIYGGTLARVSMGSPGHLASIERGDTTADGADDLIMSMNEGEETEPVWSVGVMFGTEARHLISPVPVGALAARAGLPALPSASAMVGRFLGGPDDLDMLVFDEFELMLLPGVGRGRFALDPPAARRWSVSDLMPGVDQYRANCLHFMVAAVGADAAQDQLIGVAESNCAVPIFESSGGGEPGGGGAAAPDSLGGQILIFGGATDAGTPRVARLPLPETVGALAGVWATDLDGNGQSELVLASSGVATASSVPGSSGGATAAEVAAGLFVYWNVSVDFSVPDTVAPIIDVDRRTDVELPASGAVPLAAVALNADGDVALELGLLVAEPGPAGAGVYASVHIVDFDDARGYRFAGDTALRKAISPLGVPQLATTDVDRDGLEDLIYGDGAQVFIYRAVPSGEVGGAR